ncbi:MAG: hypothetical protein K0Q87_164 [Neobacillus sp.]|nr:hypothetical protein [Neobacillus sp.]
MILVLAGWSYYSIGNDQTNGFQMAVDTSIEENGGLTPDVMNKLETLSKEKYHGRFSVKSLSGNDVKPYGTPVNYELTNTIEFPFFNLPFHANTFPGSSVSFVRGS